MTKRATQSSSRYERAHVTLPGGEAFPHRHLLGIEGLDPTEIQYLLDLADTYAEQNRSTKQSPRKRSELCEGLIQINLFFETSTRTLMSFEIAGRRLGMDTVSLATEASSIKKGETLIDTAMTLNAMRPDILVVRHAAAGAVGLLAQKVDCAVINAGDGSHEHPTQGLLDALTIRRRKGQIHGMTVAICGDVAHSRVARSNIILLNAMGAQVRVIAPPTLIPAGIETMGVTATTDMRAGLDGVDVVMMLRVQKERMDGAFIPSEEEYFRLYGLTREKLSYAKDDALIMHPGPMNRGVEIASGVADDIDRSAIQEQVEMGVAVRMACLDVLTGPTRRAGADLGAGMGADMGGDDR